MTQPNIVIITTDDQGYGDLSCMGATDFQTPHLDQLAQSGVRLTDFYSNAAVCSPSRASLMTGRYPGNCGVRVVLGCARHAQGLHPEIPTLPKALKQLGYQTAMCGKWHLGVVEEHRPHHHGFDEWFGHLSGAVDYYSHITYWNLASHAGGNPVHDLWENNREIWKNGQYVTHLTTDWATQYIERSAQDNTPFFLYVPYSAPHHTLHAPAEYLDRFPHLSPDRRIMAAMLSAVDDGVGEIVAALERVGIRENTCIFFMSDNGPCRHSRNWLDGRTDPYYGGSAGKLKGNKGSVYEGGIRVPGIFSWPGTIPADRVINEVGIAMDIFPTFLRAAGGDSSNYELDGLDILPVLAEGRPTPHADIFWERRDQTALRRGKWKLVLNGELVEGAPPEDAVHLADLEADMGERHNLKDQDPDLTAEMKDAALTWRREIDRRWLMEWKPRFNDPYILAKAVNLEEFE